MNPKIEELVKKLRNDIKELQNAHKEDPPEVPSAGLEAYWTPAGTASGPTLRYTISGGGTGNTSLSVDTTTGDIWYSTNTGTHRIIGTAYQEGITVP